MRMYLLLLLLLPLPTIAQIIPVGWVDYSFGKNGFDTINNANTISLSLFKDDSLIAAGNDEFDALIISKFDNNGQVCTSFGTNGSVHFHIPGYDDSSPQSVIVQTDGKILVARMGSDTDSNPNTSTFHDFLIVRLMPDGSFDTSFNHTGILAADFDHQENYLTEIALQPDGKILASGTTTTDTGQRLELVRFNGNGSLDFTFGYNGRAEVPISDNSSGMYLILRSDGKIVVGGNENINGAVNTDLLRFDSTGLLDSTFGINGQNIVPATYSGIYSLHVLPNNKLLASGITEIVQYNPDGHLDSTFGTNGLTYMNVNLNHIATFICNITPTSDGKIMYTLTLDSNQIANAMLARYNADGTLDTSFGNAGIIKNLIPETRTYKNYMRAVQVQSSGKIVASGYVETSIANGFGFLMRYYQASTSVPEIAGTSGQLDIYPNPTQHDVIITSTAIGDKALLHIVDMNGKLLQNQELPFNNGAAKVHTDLTPGIYTMQLIDENTGYRQMAKLTIIQ